MLNYQKPASSDFIVLESVTQQNIKIVHVIDFDFKGQAKIGRGHEADIRITDISVSRLHSYIQRDN